MLKIKANVAKSTIPEAGKGLFAAQLIPKGSLVWEFDPTIDTTMTDAEVSKMDDKSRSTYTLHAYRDKKMGLWIMCGDDAKFMNHSDSPNTMPAEKNGNPDEIDIAAIDIHPGEEIFCNYYEFDEDADRKLMDVSH